MINENIRPEQLIRELPVLPGVVQKALMLIDRPYTSASMIAKAIMKDEALSVKILRIANSPFYGFPKRICSISHAITLLGLNTIKGILIATSLFTHQDGYLLPLWQHAYNCSILTSEILQELNIKDNELVTAALLHDIGKAVIAIRLPETFKRIEKLALEKNDWCSAEKEILGFTHEEVNSCLCDLWHFPISLTHPMVFHHRIEKAKDLFKPAAALVHVVDSVMNQKEPHEFAFELLQPLLDLPPADIKKLITSFQTKTEIANLQEETK